MACGATRAEVRDWCINHIATMLGCGAGEIDPDATFARLGLDSATLVNLIIAAEEWLGIELDPEVVHEYRSINALAAHLAGLAGTGQS